MFPEFASHIIAGIVLNALYTIVMIVALYAIVMIVALE